MDSVIAISCVKGSAQTFIKGYSLNRGSRVPMISNTFKIGGLSWELFFYTGGRLEELRGKFISVALRLTSAVSNVRAMIEMQLVDQKGGAPWVQGSVTDPNQAVTFRRLGKEEKTQFWIFVETKIHIIVALPSRVNRYPAPQNEDSLVDALNGILGETDYEFEIKGERFPVHRRLVEMRCPLLLDAQDLNSTLEVDVFKAVIHFLYHDNMMPGYNSSVSSITNLLKSASKFGLAKLAIACEIRLCQDITRENCLELLVLASDMRFELLKEACMECIQRERIMAGNLKGLKNYGEIIGKPVPNSRLHEEILEAVAKVHQMVFLAGDEKPRDEGS